jgi:F-type H+-transporting ATPase subunit alpha
LEAFSKFGSDLDASTKATLEKGSRNVEILKQLQYSPMTVEKQVAIIYCGTKGLLRSVPITRVKEFENEYLLLLEAQHAATLEKIRSGVIDDSVTSVLEKAAAELTPKYK